jgi:colanic acid biosynthesis glycosyl transferase WcaI
VRLIFLNRFFWPDQSATSQMLTDLAFGLAETPAASDVIVITSRLSYDDPSALLPRQETARGVRVVRVWTSRFGRGSLPGRAIDYLTFYLSAALMLARVARRGDVVIAMTDPPLLSLVVHPIARLQHARVVNWLQDIYPEVAQALGVLRGPLRLVASILTPLRAASLRRADTNVVLGRRMAARVQALAPGHPCVVEIPNWADDAVIRPVRHADNGLRAAWGLSDAFVVAYSGNLGRAHEMATLLAAMEHLARSQGRSCIVWLFVGGGAQLAALKAEVGRRDFGNVVFQPYQPRERLAESLSAADVHLISLQPVLEGLIVPSKLYGVLAAGRAAIFIGAADGEVAQVLRAHDCGQAVGPGDGAGLAALLLAWSEAPVRVAEMGQNARRAFSQTYDRPLALARWRSLLDRIAAR